MWTPFPLSEGRRIVSRDIVGRRADACAGEKSKFFGLQSVKGGLTATTVMADISPRHTVPCIP